MPRPSRTCLTAVAALMAALVLVGCGGGGDGGDGADARAIARVVRASIDAENERDPEAFLTVWTDEGLAAYGAGGRDEIAGGTSAVFGAGPVIIRHFGPVEVEGDLAQATVDITVEEPQIVAPLRRVRFDLIRIDREWLLDGFERQGGAPPQPGVRVVDLRAAEYAFALAETRLPGRVAFRFSNEGWEHHELVLFKTPPGLDIESVTAALEHLDLQDATATPEGYSFDRVAVVEPGRTVDVTFLEALPAGSYAATCFLPRGASGPEPSTDPDAELHIQLGMINLFAVQ